MKKLFSVITFAVLVLNSMGVCATSELTKVVTVKVLGEKCYTRQEMLTIVNECARNEKKQADDLKKTYTKTDEYFQTEKITLAEFFANNR